ncbi:DUF2815 family protein [Salisediminibacterium selenitireducens]|uniref:APSE-2 prophage hypothetical n=1 Tax=Bacillus selenitireducens (strain ATCC 700615 / DSM 15326 / MLS10) TaxID=439292 RepID=D6Y005_BACIE|nr:DUF2815 family protein [Salisediminibacterium selenitireducens]ADI00507.1 APSE-2 prophage; hypothetical [[Bacillus] selenitireducens MLS10]
MTKIKIGTTQQPVRFSYANVHEPVSVKGGEPKYSVSIIIPKSHTATIQKIQAAIKETIEEQKDRFGGKVPSNVKSPLRDGDTDRPDDPAYENSYFINASDKMKPGIVGPDREDLMNPSEFYSGCYGRASLNFYVYNVNGNKGVSAGLQNLMKTEDGEPLGGRVSAEKDFADDEDESIHDVLG